MYIDNLNIHLQNSICPFCKNVLYCSKLNLSFPHSFICGIESDDCLYQCYHNPIHIHFYRSKLDKNLLMMYMKDSNYLIQSRPPINQSDLFFIKKTSNNTFSFPNIINITPDNFYQKIKTLLTFS